MIVAPDTDPYERILFIQDTHLKETSKLMRDEGYFCRRIYACYPDWWRVIFVLRKPFKEEESFELCGKAKR